MSLRAARRAGPLILLAWLAAVFAAYYAVHKPPLGALIAPAAIALPPIDPGAVGESLRSIAVAAWFGVAAYLLGRAIVRRIAASDAGLTSGHAGAAIAFAIGAGAIGWILAPIGWTGGYRPAVLAAVLIGATALGVTGRPRRALALPRPAWPAARDRVWAGFVGLTLLIGGLLALGPAIEWDALTYHLAAPRWYLEAGRIGPLPGPHFAFPDLLDLQFGLGLALGGEPSARLIGWLWAVALAVALAGVTAHWFPAAPRWAAPAIFFTAPTAARLAGWAYVDLGLALLTLLAGHLAALARGSGGRAPIVLLGVLIGFALGLKYTALAVAVAAFVVLAWPGTRCRARSIAGCGLIAVLVAAPWYGANWVWYGNPIYPVAFGGAEWDGYRAALFSRPGSGFGSEPWRLAIAPVEAVILGVEGAWGYQASLGPVVLALVPALALVRRTPGGGRLLAFAGLLLAAWLAGLAYSQLFQQGRLLLPGLAVLAGLGAGGLGALSVWDRPAWRISRIAGWALTIAAGLALIEQIVWFRAVQPIGVVIGAETRPAYLGRVLGGYARAADRANGLTGPGDRVLPIFEPRGHALDRVIRPDVALDTWGWVRARNEDPAAIAAGFRAWGATHLLVSRHGLAFLTEEPHRDVSPAELRAFDAFQRRWLDAIDGEPIAILEDPLGPRVDRRGDPYTLYRLRAG